MKKLPIDISSLLLVYALLVTPLVYTHTCTLSNTVILFLYLSCFYVIGCSLLVRVGVAHLLLPVSNAGLSIVLGGALFSTLIFVTANPVILTVLLVLFTLLLLVFSRKNMDWSVKLFLPGAFAFVVAILICISISGFDLFQQFSAHLPNRTFSFTDTYYYTAMVATIRRGSIFNAVYEVGSPLNYQVLSFFMPAMLANVLNISSHQALWGMAQPLYKVMAVLLCYEVCFFFLKDKVTRYNYLFILLALSMPVLLAPLHPLYVLKGVVKYFMLICLAYLLPNGEFSGPGSVTLPFTIILFLLTLLLFSKINWKDRKISADKLFFTLVIAVMVISKLTLYVCCGALIGVIVLKRVLFDKEKLINYIGYILGSFVISYVLSAICFTQSPITARSYVKYGLLEHFVAQGYKRSTEGMVNNMIVIGYVVFSYLLWTSIKLLGLFTLVKSKIAQLSELFTGGVAVVFFTSILASALQLAVLDKHGHVIVDSSFDLIQFVENSFYILTIISVIGMMTFFYNFKIKKTYRNILLVFTCIWCCLSLRSIVYIFDNNRHTKELSQYSWYLDNYNALKTGKYEDGLIVVNPNVNYYGIMLASSDYGKYWTAMDRSGGNYNCTRKNEYRWDMFKSLWGTHEEKYLIAMKNDGVKYIVSTPADSMAFTDISTRFPQHIHKIGDTKWIYELE